MSGGKLGCVLLASGLGRRFGGNKLLAESEGRTLLDRAMDALPAGDFQRAAVTSRYPAVLARAAERGYLPLENPLAEEGIAAGVRLGLSAMEGMDGVLFAVCDQPWLTRDSVSRLAAAFRRRPDSIHALAWEGERGNPVIFPAWLFPELAALRGDRGGGAVIARHPELLRLTRAAFPRELEDADTPDRLVPQAFRGE